MFVDPSDEIPRMSSVVIPHQEAGFQLVLPQFLSLLGVSRTLERLCDKLPLPHLHSPDTLGSGFCLLGILGNIT